MLLKSRSTTSFSSALTWKRIPTAQGSGRVMMISLSSTSPFVRPVPLPFSTTWRRVRHTEYAILHISDTSNISALAIRNRYTRAYSTRCWHALFASAISNACSCWSTVLQIFWGQCTSNRSGGGVAEGVVVCSFIFVVDE